MIVKSSFILVGDPEGFGYKFFSKILSRFDLTLDVVDTTKEGFYDEFRGVVKQCSESRFEKILIFDVECNGMREYAGNAGVIWYDYSEILKRLI